MRTLTFTDDAGHVETWTEGEPDPDASPFDNPGAEAFDDFVARAGLTVPGVDLGLAALRRSQAVVAAARALTGGPR